MDVDETKRWCSAQGLKVSARGYVDFGGAELHCLSIGIDEKPSRVLALADYMVPTWDDVPFDGALLWYREWNAWGGYSDSTGQRIVQQLRAAQGETLPLEACPGMHFRRSEFLDMHSFLLVPMLFGWDAFLVLEGRDFFFFVSHDGILEVVCRSAATQGLLSERLGEWHPKEDAGWYSRLARTQSAATELP